MRNAEGARATRAGGAAPWDPEAERAALRRVAAAVVDGSDPGAALTLAAREVAALADAEQGFVFRVDGDDVVVAGAAGVERAPVGARHALLPDGVVPRILRGRRPARVEGRPRPLGRENSTTWWIAPVYHGGVGAPVFVGERLWGAVVAATTRPEPLPAGAEARLAWFGEMAGVAIGHAEARAALARLALSDPLTGLANHRAFHEALERESARAARHRRRLALVLIDVDHFKDVNDRHGHLAGDATLAEVAERLRGAARTGDLLARVGGEEFGWLLPETSAEAARLVADRARRLVSARAVPGVGPVTVSAGVAELRGPGDPRDLYRRADDALYRAKRLGRDRCCADGTPAGGAEGQAGGAPALTAAVCALARAVDARDPATRGHSERVGRLAERLALAAGWPPDRAAALSVAGLIHDVGKSALDDAILLARPPLGADAREALRRHPVLGAEIAGGALSPEQAAWVRGHHERWDGMGFPDGLAGERIPQGARLLAVADAWDRLTACRPRPAGGSGPLALLRREVGRRFCPRAAEALARVLEGGP